MSSLDKEYKDDSLDKGSQRQGDPDVHQRLSKQERISHSELTVASHIFCLTESKVGYWFIQLGRIGARESTIGPQTGFANGCGATKVIKGGARRGSGGVGVGEGGGEDAAAHLGQHPSHLGGGQRPGASHCTSALLTILRVLCSIKDQPEEDFI